MTDSAPTAHALREELVDTVKRDLLGPAAGDDEEIDVPRVRDRYLLGMLAPSGWIPG